MPKNPRGERRPADVIGNAVKVMRIANNCSKKKVFAGTKVIGKFRAWEKGKLGKLIFERETHRCHRLSLTWRTRAAPRHEGHPAEDRRWKVGLDLRR
jgi:hypothetical protein